MTWRGQWDGPWDGGWEGAGEPAAPGAIAANLQGSASLTGTLATVTAARRILRSRRWRPLPEWIEELPEPVKAELPKADAGALARAVVAEVRAQATAAARRYAETAAKAENLATERRKLREARATLFRAELALREAEEAAARHLARLREEDEFLLMA